MSDKEMKKIWQSANDGDRINLSLSQLLDSLKTKMKKIDRTLFFRDAREIVAAVLVAVFFACKAFTEDISVPKLANLLIAIWAVYVIYRLLDVRKYKKVSDLSASVKAQLTQQKMYLQKQAHLLDSALSWYIAPPAVLGMLSIIGRSYGDVIDWGNIGLSFFIIFLISWGIYALNKRAARKAYQPLIENIDSVLMQLEEN